MPAADLKPFTVAGSELDRREVALWVSRGRAVMGLTCLFLPGLVTRVWLRTHSPEAKALARVAGIRDLTLAVGAITNIKEQNQDAEWLGMGAVSDLADAVVGLATPKLPLRARLVGLFAAASGTAALKLSRDLADAREAPLR